MAKQSIYIDEKKLEELKAIITQQYNLIENSTPFTDLTLNLCLYQVEYLIRRIKAIPEEQRIKKNLLEDELTFYKQNILDFDKHIHRYDMIIKNTDNEKVILGATIKLNEVEEKKQQLMKKIKIAEYSLSHIQYDFTDFKMITTLRKDISNEILKLFNALKSHGLTPASKHVLLSTVRDNIASLFGDENE